MSQCFWWLDGGQGVTGTDRAPVLLLLAGRFVTEGDSFAVMRHAISALLPSLPAGSTFRPWRAERTSLCAHGRVTWSPGMPALRDAMRRLRAPGGRVIR